MPIPECNDQALYRYTFILLDEILERNYEILERNFLFPVHSLPNLLTTLPTAEILVAKMRGHGSQWFYI